MAGSGEIQGQLAEYRETYGQLDQVVGEHLRPYRDKGLSDELIHGSELSFRAVQYDVSIIVATIPPSARGFVIKTVDALDDNQADKRSSVSNPEFEARRPDSDNRAEKIRNMRHALRILASEGTLFYGLKLQPIETDTDKTT